MKIQYQRNLKKFSLLMLSILMSWSFYGYAAGTAGKCTRVTSTRDLSASAIAEGYTAKSWSGAGDSASQSSLGLPSVVSISSLNAFQPSGSLLASSVADVLTSGHKVAYEPKQILFKCDAAAANDGLFEFYATNGDDDYGGKYETAEIPGAYFTFVQNVAIRLTNLTTGEYYSRYWKSRQLPQEALYSDGTYTYVPASAFSNVFVELFKVEEVSRNPNKSRVYLYGRNQPAGYLAFKGGGRSPALVDNADHNSNHSGFSAAWPAGWSLTNYVTFVRGASCKVKDYPSRVLMPKITVNELNQGDTSRANFTVSLECESGAVSSTANSVDGNNGSSNVAMGFLVNQTTAVSKAQELKLANSSGGLTWLLDTHYGTPGQAAGVGIRILDKNDNYLNLLPAKTYFGGGNSAGWYGFKDLLTLSGSGKTSDVYTGNFTAELGMIPNQKVTAGAVNAQLQVYVSFQ